MKKIVLQVSNCRDCIYCSWDDGLCDHVCIEGKEINEDGEIPDWCPLEEHEEKGLTKPIKISGWLKLEEYE